jgi:hypothetical protein
MVAAMLDGETLGERGPDMRALLALDGEQIGEHLGLGLLAVSVRHRGVVIGFRCDLGRERDSTRRMVRVVACLQQHP